MVLLVIHLIATLTGQTTTANVFLGESRTQKDARLSEVLVIGDKEDNWILNAQAVARLQDGALLISDKLSYCVKMFNDKGRKLKDFGKRGKDAGEFRGPGPISACKGLIAVADFASPRVQVFSETLKGLEVPDGNITWGVAVDPRRNIYILCADYAAQANRDVCVFDSSGKYITQFTLPFAASHIWIDSQGFLYTVEKNRTLVKKYRLPSFSPRFDSR